MTVTANPHGHTVFITYPRHGWIPDSEIGMWFADAVTTGLIPATAARAETPQAMACALQDAGIIVVGVFK